MMSKYYGVTLSLLIKLQIKNGLLIEKIKNGIHPVNGKYFGSLKYDIYFGQKNDVYISILSSCVQKSIC